MIASNQRISEEFDAIPDNIEGGDGDIDATLKKEDVIITADTPEVDDDDIDDNEEGGPGNG